MTKLFLLFVLISLTSCVSSPKYSWEKQNATQHDWYIDQGQCGAQADSVPGMRLAQVVRVFESCLQGKGWYRVEIQNK